MNRRTACACVALTAGLLVGCATKKFDGQATQTASELTVALAVYHSGLVDRPFVATSTPPHPSGQYRLVSRWWCEPNTRASSVDAAKNEYTALCSRLGGLFQGDFCVKPENTDDVLFMAQVVRAPQPCVNGASVRVVEPTESHSAPTYVSALRSLGFRTSEDRAADRLREAALAARRQERLELEAERRAAMLPRMRERGTRICRTEDGITTVGFVEDSTEMKLQIRVVNAYPTRVPKLQVGGFQPHITWDTPTRWEMCD